MKKVIAGIAISAMALMSGAPSAVAAPAPSTLVLSGGSGVYQLDPIVVNATASAAGVVAFKLSGKVIAGCDAVATTTVAPFVAKCSWVPAAAVQWRYLVHLHLLIQQTLPQLIHQR